MRTDENGQPCPATLGEYRDLCAAISGDTNKAVKYLDEKIAQAANGRDELVVQEDSQMRAILMPMMLEGFMTEGSFPTTDGLNQAIGMIHGARTNKPVALNVEITGSEIGNRTVKERWTIDTSNPFAASLYRQGEDTAFMSMPYVVFDQLLNERKIEEPGHDLKVKILDIIFEAEIAEGEKDDGTSQNHS